jgi:hypothetical protein
MTKKDLKPLIEKFILECYETETGDYHNGELLYSTKGVEPNFKNFLLWIKNESYNMK